jgi:integrase
MPTAKFLLQDPYEKTKSGTKKPVSKETRIYCYLIFSKGEITESNKELPNTIKIKTEYKIKPTEWDFDKQLKRDKLAGAIEFNRRLNNLKEEILNKYYELKDDPAHDSAIQIKQQLQEWGKLKENPFLIREKSFFNVFDEFITAQENRLAPRTIQKFNTLKTTLEEFAEANPKYQLLTFSMINHSFMDDFISHLRVRKPRGRQKTRPEGEQDGLLTDTTGKYVENLKSFLKWAEERGYNKNLTYKEFKMFSSADKKRIKRKNDIVTLTAQELRDLYTHEFPLGSTLDRVRDLFCFGCYTGQRWGDISRFKKGDLEGDVWTFVTDKTKEEISVDLVGYAAPALDILKKYEYKLPQISLQKFNDYIKKAAEAAGIDTPTTLTRYVGSKEIKITNPKHKFIGSHCARRTCVSLLLNVYNMPITAVMEITGHSDLKTLQKYINPDRAARRAKMASTTPVTEPLTVKKNNAV